MPRIDSHHHLWRYTGHEYGWIGDDMRRLRRDFLVRDLWAEVDKARVDGTIAVQARQTVEETHWLLDAATGDSPIWGVVGWLPIADAGFVPLLDSFLAKPRLKGLRHVVQNEPAGFLDDNEFNRGMRSLRDTRLVYDLLIYAHQLEEAIRFVDRHPQQQFVLDHIAKPNIRNNELAAWSIGIRRLAQRPTVCCKLSGMVTEADFQHWTADQLRPYFDVALHAFGPDRLMIGTDWPVLTVGCAYAEWWSLVERWIGPLSAGEQDAVLGETAVRVYKLTQTNSTLKTNGISK